MKLYKCQYPGCKNPEEYRATNDCAEWVHVCEAHLGYTWYPDAWEKVQSTPVKASGTTRRG